MNKHQKTELVKPELVDAENPEWTAETFAKARPANEVLSQLLGEKTAKTLLKPRGRPVAASTKERINIRLSPDVLASFRTAGAGWQTRIDAALKDWLKSHSPV
jgi:uncharacterized protein (DUF4415 family)